jgi:hypothetical protein
VGRAPSPAAVEVGFGFGLGFGLTKSQHDIKSFQPKSNQ